ncbi:hypothetical protein ACLIBH_06065 [Virgibacillus sp. W0430]|uniref:hypothetical protein n=1 Tax=Virgibacillus sp. W0430 TaxID=3391580 RepID=UPI003F468E7A
MQLIHKDKKFLIKNDDSLINILFGKVNELIQQKDVVFSHLLIDGTEVYENHEAYIQEKINEIIEIEIVTKTKKDLIWETMQSVHEYLQRAIPALKSLVNDSYEGFSEETWQGIDQLAEGMQWMVQFSTYTKTVSGKPTNWSNIESSMTICEKSFAQLLEAVEAQDTVLISDILAYEITPAYESLAKNVTISLQDEEYIKHVN